MQRHHPPGCTAIRDRGLGSRRGWPQGSRVQPAEALGKASVLEAGMLSGPGTPPPRTAVPTPSGEEQGRGEVGCQDSPQGSLEGLWGAGWHPLFCDSGRSFFRDCLTPRSTCCLQCGPVVTSRVVRFLRVRPPLGRGAPSEGCVGSGGLRHGGCEAALRGRRQRRSPGERGLETQAGLSGGGVGPGLAVVRGRSAGPPGLGSGSARGGLRLRRRRGLRRPGRAPCALRPRAPHLVSLPAM